MPRARHNEVRCRYSRSITIRSTRLRDVRPRQVAIAERSGGSKCRRRVVGQTSMVGQRPAAFYRRPRVGQHRRMSMTGRVAVRTRSRTGRSLLGDATTGGWVRVVVGVRTTEHRALRHVPLQDALGTLLLLARSRSQHRRTDGGHLGRGRQRHMYGALNTQTRVRSSNHQFQRPLGLSRIVVIIIIIINEYYSAVGSKKLQEHLTTE